MTSVKKWKILAQRINHLMLTTPPLYYKCTYIVAPMHSTSWKFSRNFVHNYWTVRVFLTKFRSSDLSFNWSILTLLHLKFETFAHAQIAVIHYYILITSFLTWMSLKLTLGLVFDKWTWSMILSTWSRVLWSANLDPTLLCPKVKFMVCLNVSISLRKLETL